jgi:high mobility group protein B1
MLFYRNLKKKKQVSGDDKPKKRQSKKERDAKKDPNKPKRAPSAFFVFL